MIDALTFAIFCIGLPLGLIAAVLWIRSVSLRGFLVITTVAWCPASFALAGLGFHSTRWDMVIAETGISLAMLSFCVCAAKVLHSTNRSASAVTTWALLLGVAQVSPLRPGLLQLCALVAVLVF